MSELTEKFNQLIEEQEKLRAQFQETAQALFKETTKEFFDNNPTITAVVWRQYTPYFNDGEPCTFNVYEPVFTNAPDPENVRYEYEGEEENVFAVDNIGYVLESNSPYYENVKQLIQKLGGVDANSCNEFSSMICSPAMEDVMLEMFGDHVKIIATRDGFEVDDYDHD